MDIPAPGEMPPAAVIVAGAADQAVAGAITAPSSDHGVVTVAVPANGRFLTSQPLDAMVADAVDRTLDAAAAEAPPAVEESADTPVTAAAVVAAHDARIAILHQRMASLRGQGAPVTLLDAMSLRLRRAEAARSLAAARLKGTVASADATSDPLPHRRPPAVAPPAGTGHRLAQRSAAASPRLTVSLHLPAGSPAGRPHPIASTTGRFAFGHAATTRVAVVAAHRHDDRHRPAVRRLAEARRALATARRLLGSGGAVPTMPTARAVVLTGLWRWQGSDSWSLAPSDAGRRA